MLRPRYLGVLWLSCLISHAQSAPIQQAQVDSATVYKLEGTVLNAHTGRGIPYALVEAYGPGKFAVLTGSDGSFVLEQLPKGPLMLGARKPGFSQPGDAGPRPPLKTIQIGPQLDKVVLRLVPDCAISGEVSDDKGDPLEGVVVEVLSMKLFDGRRTPAPIQGNLRTNEEGAFRAGGLPAGRYYVSVKAGSVTRRILGSKSKAGTDAYPALVYYSSADDLKSATPIDLVAGQRAHVQFSLRLGPAFKLGGAITGMPVYKSLSPPFIADSLERPLFYANRWDNQSGAFEFPAIPAGVYNLRTYGVDADDNSLWLKQTVTLNRDINNLNLTFQPIVTIPVTVRSEFTGTSVRRQCVQLSKEQDCVPIAAMVYLSSVDSPGMRRGTQPGGESDSSPLVVRGIVPGRYHVWAMSMTGGYVHSLRSGGMDLFREELVVPAGGNAPTIEVVLRDGGGTVKVHVESDASEKQGRILLIAEFAPNQPPVIFDIDANQDREYGSFAPGDYKVLAFDSLSVVEYNDPEFLNKYSARAARVTVTAHATSPVTVELIHTGE